MAGIDELVRFDAESNRNLDGADLNMFYMLLDFPLVSSLYAGLSYSSPGFSLTY